MTSFSEKKVKEIQKYYKENKGKCLACRKSNKQYGLKDLAKEYGLTDGQARRILYVR